MLRELHHIPLHQLKVSKLNVRRQGAKEIDSLAASISVLGIIQPLLVRSEGDGYEIVAGRRRYLAAKKLDADGRPEAGTVVPCVLLEADDDATALEASLAENVERLPMDELEQYEAFAALRRKGLSEAEIAAHFAISEQVVKRRLAIAGLHPDIRRLYRAGDIDSQTLQLLTLATKERQKAWLALNNDPEQEPPPAWQLKAWLLGGVEISTAAALFDEAVYQGGIAADLFGEQRYFTDPDEFWRLQNAAIAEQRERLLATGWAQVQIIEPDRRFQPWDYESVSKANGGAAYIVVEPDGHVTVHKGFRPRGEAQRTKRTLDKDESANAVTATERPEMSAPLANYVDLIRHSAVRLAVADAPEIALRLMLAHVIGGGRLWKIEPEPQRPETPAIGEAVAALVSESAFAKRRAKAAKLLRAEAEGAAIVAHDASGARTAEIFARLLDMTDAHVLQVLALVMAETLAAGTDQIDTLGERLKVDCLQHWQPDETFFALVKDREAVTAMLAEVIGETAATSYLTETGTKKKAIIRKALAGEGRTKVENWTPRYMAFPQRGYTGRMMTAPPRAGT